MENDKSVVAIDDISDNLLSYRALLSEFFPEIKVHVATSGVVGLDLIRKHKPKVILLDIFMPEMDGYEVCEAIKSESDIQDIPVIIITASGGDKDVKIRTLEAGADAFLSKPIDTSEFIAQIRAMMKISEMNQQKRTENERLSVLVEQRTHQLRRSHKKTLDLYHELEKENQSRIKSESELIEAQKIAKIASFDVDLTNNLISWSEEAIDLFELADLHDLDSMEKIRLFFFNNDDELFETLDSRFKNGEELIQFMKTFINKNNENRYFDVRIMTLHSDDGISYKIRGTVQDITKQIEAEKQLIYMSEHDYLTDLYNRMYFEEMILKYDSEDYFPLTIVMADVNGLKIINDSFGHAIGDQLLIRTARILMENAYSDAIISRLGGDEFVALLPHCDESRAITWVDKLKDIANQDDSQIIGLSISYGVATKSNKEESIQSVLKKAEDDMYRHKITESSSMRSKSVDLIMNALFAKSMRELDHSKRVSEICESIGRVIFENQDDIKQIRIAGLLHDIGKIGIDEKILNKNGKLDFEEYNEIKKHSEIGFRILSSVNEFSELAKYVLEHHEKYDGTGYPHGLIGENISIQARIMAVADAYDAMTSDRSYRKGMSHQEAVEELVRYSGSQFDKKIVDIFIKVSEK